MTRCWASEFRSQALIFLGNRRLLVSTVHFSALQGGAAKSDITTWTASAPTERVTIQVGSRHRFNMF